MISRSRRLARHATALLANSKLIQSPLRAATAAGIVPRAVWSKLPADSTFIVSIGASRFYYVGGAADSLGRMLLWAGIRYFEPETVRVFARLAARAQIIFDVGANTGIYSLTALAVNPSVHVVAFEPINHIAAQLSRSVMKNRWTDRCRIVIAAVSDQSGEADFFIPDLEMPTTSTLEVGNETREGKIVRVRTVTIDSVARETVPPCLVKIDVEGAEPAVLRGMATTLQSAQPVVIIECNFGGPAAELTRLLACHAYRFFRLDMSGIAEIDSISPDPSRQFRNFLCVPAPKLSWLEDLDRAQRA